MNGRRRFLIAALALTLIGVPGRSANTAQPAPFAVAPLAVGVSWYPEQWPEDRWDADLALMQRANLSVIRIGEFAWTRMEPEDERFDFAWLDRAIAAAAAHGLRVVIGTPSAAPPIWLTEGHPEIRRVESNGQVQGHGERRQFSVASPLYRRYATRIAAELARRYGHNPAVVGWQIDNEIGLESFDAQAKANWADWLAKRYGTIDALNQRWSTQYWSQRYERFDQVPLTQMPDQNPALVLDTRRFFSSQWADYVAAQVGAIRRHADHHQFVTINSTAWNNHFDQYQVHRGLDFAAWDEYVPDGRPDWSALALHHAVVHGYLRHNFWVMETQPGHVNWGANNRSLDPGDTRMLAWQAVARGADAILYWQWRSAPGGQEQYHGTLAGPDGQPTPIYAEIARTTAEFGRIGKTLSGTVPVAKVAMLYSQDSRWAIEQQRFAGGYDPVAVMKAWYHPFYRRGIAVDVFAPDVDLRGYALVLAPGLNVLDGPTATHLSDYVQAGGTLVLGPRSGMKDGDNALWPSRQPGPLAKVLGATVEDFHALDEDAKIDGLGAGAVAHGWAEILTPQRDVSMLARYTTGAWLAGKPMAVSRRAGAGTIAYVGGLLNEAGQDGLTRLLLSRTGLATAAVPRDVEVAERVGRTGRYRFFLNHSDHPAQIALLPGYRPVAGDLVGTTLPSKGVALVKVTSQAQ